MTFSRKSLASALTVVVVVLGVLLAAILLLLGVANLIRPDVSPGDLAQNARVCVTVILAGLGSIYALLRPYSGGVLLLVCAVALGVVFGGFFRNPITSAVLLLGVLSVVRALLSRPRPRDGHDEDSRNSTNA